MNGRLTGVPGFLSLPTAGLGIITKMARRFSWYRLCCTLLFVMREASLS